MYMGMTVFQLLEETVRCDVCYQLLSCTPALHQENSPSRWPSSTLALEWAWHVVHYLQPGLAFLWQCMMQVKEGEMLSCGNHWDSQGYLWHVLCSDAQSCPTLCKPMDCSPPGSSAHRISQARILEWASISSSRGLNPHLLHLLHWQMDFFTSSPTWASHLWRSKTKWKQTKMSSKQVKNHVQHTSFEYEANCHQNLKRTIIPCVVSFSMPE